MSRTTKKHAAGISPGRRKGRRLVDGTEAKLPRMTTCPCCGARTRKWASDGVCFDCAVEIGEEALRQDGTDPDSLAW